MLWIKKIMTCGRYKRVDPFNEMHLGENNHHSK